MRTLRKKFDNLPLFQKLFLLLSVTTILLGVVYFANLQYLARTYDEKLYSITSNGLIRVTSTIEDEMTAIENISAYAMTNEVIQENLEKLSKTYARESTCRRKIYEELYKYFYRSPYITSITVLKEDYVINMGRTFSLTDGVKAKINVEALGKEGHAFWKYGRITNEQMMCVRQVRQVKMVSMKNLGMIYIGIDMDKLVKDALQKNGYMEEAEGLRIFAEDGIIYEGQKAKNIKYDKSNPVEQNGYSIETIDGEKEFVVKGRMFQDKWEYLLMQEYDKLFQQIQIVKFGTVILVLIACVAIIFLVRASLKELFKDIDYLMQKIEMFGSGLAISAESERKYENRTDEIGEMHRAFDEMSHSVKVLRDENYDKQILLRDAEIKMLEQQINPHFLYNTLDSINWMAQIYQADDISEMSRALANIFRVSISEKRELILLKEELDLLNNYIKIQEIRFKDRLEFKIICPEDAEELYIPKLCIQPLVENALKYGLECNEEGCVIQVLVEKMKEEKYYKILVTNTGSVFEEEFLEKLKTHAVIPQGTGVGIANIDSRLRLIYGDDYGLRFRNADGNAIVELRIPMEKREKTQREEREESCYA